MAGREQKRFRELVSDWLSTTDAEEAFKALKEFAFADKARQVDCPNPCCSGRKGRFTIEVPDWGARVQAMRFMAEHAEGRVAPETPKPAPVGNGGRVHRLTEAELNGLLLGAADEEPVPAHTDAQGTSHAA